MADRSYTVQYRREPEGWWAESPELPGFSAAGEDFAEVRRLAREGLQFFVGEPVAIAEEGVPVAAAWNGVFCRVSEVTFSVHATVFWNNMPDAGWAAQVLPGGGRDEDLDAELEPA
jgi:predicted RNase H-like HicB family nuclease